jgi:hypothetical protein
VKICDERELEYIMDCINFEGKGNYYSFNTYFSGAKMEELAKRLLDVRKCEFEPHHKNNLANEFYCYANYDINIDLK